MGQIEKYIMKNRELWIVSPRRIWNRIRKELKRINPGKTMDWASAAMVLLFLVQP